jgi:hypothetical protein
MFEYCVRELHMSEAEAFVRIRAARLSRSFPVVLGMVERGELDLSALKLLAPILNRENSAELLAQARFKSKREVEHMLADRLAAPAVPSVIRKLPVSAKERTVSSRECVSSVPLALDLQRVEEGRRERDSRA